MNQTFLTTFENNVLQKKLLPKHYFCCGFSIRRDFFVKIFAFTFEFAVAEANHRNTVINYTI